MTYFGNNFISQMVEEAIRGTSTLDLILTKKKKIVGEMKIDRNRHFEGSKSISELSINMGTYKLC